jgi:hypothetical protein
VLCYSGGLNPELQETLSVIQHSLSTQMASQMDGLLQRMGDLLRPTTQRLAKLERVVEKLSTAVRVPMDDE